MTADHINGLFELVGAILTWLNVKAYLRDREIKGINWYVTAFFAGWGVWNLYYYPLLGQWASFWGGVLLVAGNLTWLFLVMRDVYYRNDTIS